MKYALTLVFLMSYMTATFSQEEERAIDIETRKSYRQECLEVAKYAVGNKIHVKCYYNYHHFNTAAKNYYKKTDAIEDGKVKIAEFNVLHPGMRKSRYKDYKKIAQLINRWDVVGVTELLPLLSGDLRHNQALVKFITQDGPNKLKKLKLDLVAQNKRLKSKSTRTVNSAKAKIEQIKAQIKSIEADLKRAPSLYRDPGYLSILKELRKLKGGKQWGLILSPRGEAAKKTDVQELVGYYYRGSKVKPKVSQYCKDIRAYGKGTPVACIPNMGAQMLGVSKADVFSRRPFMAEFISGKFSFTLLTSHVVYNSPRETELMANILKKSFGVYHYNDLGVGINADNYARFAEVKVTLEFMQQLRKKFRQKDIIFLGDLNLESDNKFWDEVLPAMPGIKLYVTEKTTISESRYNKDGTETFGLANDFDHFLFDPSETDECVDKYGKVKTKVESFYEGTTGRWLRHQYKVRKERMYAGRYVKNNKKYDALVDEFITPLKTKKALNETIGFKYLRAGGKRIRVRGIIEDDDKTEKYIEGFFERILDSQLYDDSYYSFYKQLISDHMPISMECATN